MKVANHLDFKKFLIMPPAFIKYGDKDVINYYTKIMEAIPESEIILYNFEKLCGYKFSVDCVKELVNNFQSKLLELKTAHTTYLKILKLDNFSVLPGSESKC